MHIKFVLLHNIRMQMFSWHAGYHWNAHCDTMDTSVWDTHPDIKATSVWDMATPAWDMATSV